MTIDRQATHPRRPDANGMPWPFEAFPLWLKASTFDLPVAIGTEMLHFMARRLEAQASFWHDIGRCHGLPEAVERQTAFAQQAITDYTEEFATLMRKAEWSGRSTDSPA